APLPNSTSRCSGERCAWRAEILTTSGFGLIRTTPDVPREESKRFSKTSRTTRSTSLRLYETGLFNTGPGICDMLSNLGNGHRDPCVRKKFLPCVCNSRIDDHPVDSIESAQ